jgi:phosphoesterase RecJ-like protein
VTTQDIQKLKKFLAEPRKIAIIMHKGPDGDAIGSSLGLYHFLLKFKHKVSVISPDSYPDFLKWMQGTKDIIDYSKSASEALKAIRTAELIFCLDFNALKRIDDLGKEVAKSKALKVLIDHHPQPENFANFVLHSVQASSTGELVFDFIEMMGGKEKINRAIANCLYAGIMTDTGSFAFSSTSIHTHEVAAELMRRGAETTRVHQLINNNNRESRLRLFGYSLLEKMKILPEYATGFIALTQSDLKRFDYKDGDTEGLVNEPLSIKGVAFSALFTEKANDEGIKISFRSKGKFDVNLFARAHFNGGGHMNASGGSSDLSMDETISKFIELLVSYKDQLRSK